MLRYLLVVSLLFPLTAIAQDYLGKTKSALRKELKEYTSGSRKAQVLSETDSTLVVSPKADAIRPVTYI
jgi:hypothetical protein